MATETTETNGQFSSPPTKKLLYGFAKRHQVLIQASVPPELIYTDKTEPTVLMEVRRSLQQSVKMRLVTQEQFNTLLVTTYETNTSQTVQMAADISEELDLQSMAQELQHTEELLESADDAPIIRLINALLSQAIKENASDIHIESYEEELMIRFRVDGVLRVVLKPQRLLAPLIVSRIKVMAKLDISEKRLPQDGRIGLRVGGRAIDVRVSTMPSNHGERVVLRLLDKQAGRLDLKHLGMAHESLRIMQALVARPHGIILVTGPTGAGKSTTLYAALTRLNEATRNILTVEDPIEYDLPGIGQTQVNAKIDMTFAKGLRAILRQDPDVVMIGEIRDLETAEIAVQASLTGHLVLSTLHTNTAIGAVTRLRDMGVESFLLSSSLVGLVAQRLVRTLCPQCKAPEVATETECAFLNVSTANPPTIYHAAGCSACNGLGYWGRTGIYEVVPVDDDLRKMIHEDAGEQAMEALAHSRVSSIREDGVRRVLEGDTTIEEVMRVTTES
ncbi:MAG: type II secretion system ATPase GspE [Gammaproteobacteria bacterium]